MIKVSKDILRCRPGTHVRLLSFQYSEQSEGFWVAKQGKEWLQLFKKHGAIIFTPLSAYYQKAGYSPNRGGYRGGLRIYDREEDGWVYVHRAWIIPWEEGGEEINVACSRGRGLREGLRGS